MRAFVAAAQGARPVVPVALRGTGWSDAVALKDAACRAILARCGEPDHA